MSQKPESGFKYPSETRMYDDLIQIAANIRQSDPVGALVVRKAAAFLAKSACLRCPLQYNNGYAAGYKAGNAGVDAGQSRERR